MVAKETTSTSRGAAVARPKPASARASAAATAARKTAAPSITTFFQESRAELRKVTWPTRQETINLTVAVIAMTVAVAAFLGIVDAILNYIITPLIGK